MAFSPADMPLRRPERPKEIVPPKVLLERQRDAEIRVAKSYRLFMIERGVDEEAAEDVLRIAVWMRDGGRCRYCAAPVAFGQTGDVPTEIRMTLDHVVPISRGGSHTYENVYTCCKTCNLSKGNLTLAQWQPPLPLFI